MNMEATVFRLNMTQPDSFYRFVQYEDGEKAYILAPQRLAEGDKIVSSDRADIKIGNTLPLKNMPVGTIIHNVEMKPVKVVRWRVLLEHLLSWLVAIRGYAQIKLSSENAFGSW